MGFLFALNLAILPSENNTRWLPRTSKSIVPHKCILSCIAASSFPAAASRRGGGGANAHRRARHDRGHRRGLLHEIHD